MPRLSKTALAILAESKERGRRIVGVGRGSGRGGQGGKIHYGARRWAAALELVDAGKARRVGDIVRSRHYSNGNCVDHSDLVIEILGG